MLLLVGLFAAILVGCWLYCLADAIRTPSAAFRALPKWAWITLIAVTFVAGAIAWLTTRHHRRKRRIPYSNGRHWTAADEAVARHPAGRSRTAGPVVSRPRGPDDDLEFLKQLDRLIHGSADTDERG
jgi:uncharacterized membrane protein YbhN (UPF0104 family)